VTEALRITNSTDAAAAELEVFYDEVLAPSFDSAELVERSELLGALADPASETRGSIAFDEDGHIVGGIIGDWFARCRVMLTSYVATRPGLRGRGIGTQLLAEVLPAWTSQFGAVLTVAEVENPRFYHADEYHGDPEARLRLYATTLGAKILDIPYFQPALTAQKSRVRNLFLMVFSADQAVMSENNKIDAATLRCFIEEYLAGTEGDVDDDEVRALREALQTDEGVALVDPAEYLGKP
jgi:GNAT superfamily N-acetyltransferase